MPILIFIHHESAFYTEGTGSRLASDLDEEGRGFPTLSFLIRTDFAIEFSLRSSRKVNALLF